MIPRLRPCIGWPEIRAACAPGSGDDVPRFERAFAELMGQRHAVAFPYGRTALVALLHAMGIRGKQVICPAYTCVVVPHAIVTSGNEPVFVDSRDSDFNMDLDRTAQAITPDTAAIVATSIFGYPVDLDRLQQVRQRHAHVRIIQDCAHSFAAAWNGRPVQQAGDAAMFGLNISKVITSIFGGMITTDDAVLADRLADQRERLVRRRRGKEWARRAYLVASALSLAPPIYRAVHRLERIGALDRFVKYYDDDQIDMPADWQKALTRAEARVGRVQVRRYHDIVAARRDNALAYDRALRDHPTLRLPPIVDGATYSHYTVRTPHRERYIEHAARRGIQLGRIIEYCVPDMPAYRDRPGSRGDFPVARAMAREALNLPVWRGCDVEAVIRCVGSIA